MARRVVDEEELLKAYKLRTLHPQSWEAAEAQADTYDASSEDWADPLGLRSVPPTSRLDPDQRAQISINSKVFDAKTFLNIVHPNASFADLSRGSQQLKSAISQRSEALKVLVDENFDRFVSVKSTTDGVFAEMAAPGGPLAKDSDYGVTPLRESLQTASSRADQVFRPVLENYVKAMKLRNTLGVFQRSHFFFNLPGSLNENIQQGHYEAALRDYKKGKYLLETRPNQLLPVHESSSNAPNSELQTMQQRQIFSKVWDAVEDAMYAMQKRLLLQLRESQHNVDDQEKCIEVLLELDPTTDPVNVFLASQHQNIQTQLRSAFDHEQDSIKQARVSIKNLRTSPIDQAKDLSQCLLLVRTSYGTKPNFSRALNAPVWEAIEQMANKLCSTVSQTVPKFWRIARNYSEGRFGQERGSSSTQIRAQAQAWAAGNVDLLVTQLTSFFGLESFASRMKQPLFDKLPSWVPEPSCSLSTSHYMSSILGALTDTLNEIHSLNIPTLSKQLESLRTDLRLQFTEVLCCLWLRDARLCYHLENWTPNTQQPSITSYLFSLSVFNRWNAREGFYLADGRSKTQQDSTTNQATQVLAAFRDRLKFTFIQALHAFLDGIVQAALAPNQGAALEPRGTDATRTAGLDRILGAWIRQFEEAYHVSLQSEQEVRFFVSLQIQQLISVCTKLDQDLLNDYVRRKSEAMSGELEKGIMDSGIDWARHSNPESVHAYVYQALLHLVEVHAQIRATVPPLVSRVISALVEILAEAALHAYGQVPAYNKGGMLQATLEIEFIHQTMSFYVSSNAEHTLKRVYETISQRYSSGLHSADDHGELRQTELEAVKHTLITSRKATALEFLCFRRPKSEDAKSKSKAKNPT
ncbi:Exocyst complex component S5 [Malassezia psittaci]|uniref:Exocyst complex component SEC5 n=1 Tax=Malassezia psittaci TaxID=1821823 RepID=A0AAF0JET5_9BASI|nr:Exocyst complex component S5 [Malassezia psittaci]